LNQGPEEGFLLWPFSNRFAKKIMACSARVRVRTNYARTDGTSQVYLQLIINREVKWLPLELHWPLSYFDQAAGLATPQKARDKNAA
jgi:hypothetical protein